VKNLLSTKEVAAYLGVNEKMVYSLISEKGLPATKITGKWLFPAHLVEQWVEGSTMNAPKGSLSGTTAFGQPTDPTSDGQTTNSQSGAAPCFAGASDGMLIIAGSNDMLMERTMSLFMQQNPSYLVAFANLGSLEGLRAISRGACHMATSHLMQDDGEDYNFDHTERELKSAPAVVNFCYREQGIVTRVGNPLNITTIRDIADKQLRFVNRATGTGTRLLFDKQLAAANVPPDTVQGYGNVVGRHLDVGLEVVSGKADAGLAIRPVAEMLGLHFIPLRRERFDLIIPHSYYFNKPVQQFLSLLTTPEFQKLVESMPGYDLQRSGRVVFRGDATP